MDFKLDEEYFNERLEECEWSYPWPSTRMDCCLDVGANVGAFSALISKYCDQVISFEPYTPNYNFMTELLKVNNIDNVRVYNKALHHTHGIDVNMTVLKENSDSKDISTTPNSYGDNVELGSVKTVSFSNVISEYPEIDYIKVDCEGCEYDILMGQDLSKIKCLVVEIHGGYIGMKKSRELINYLGTQFKNIHNHHEGHHLFVFDNMEGKINFVDPSTQTALRMSSRSKVPKINENKTRRIKE
jgi:FkbM family methyltransferase